MKRLLLASTALLTTGAIAVASDMPREWAEPDPIIYETTDPDFSWTGFYAGVHAGASWQDQRVQRGVIEGSVFPAFDFDAGLAEEAAEGDGSALELIFPEEFGVSNALGAMGGVQAGYNHQFGNFVLGVEADISYLGNRSEDSSSVQAFESPDTEAIGVADFYTDLRTRSSLDWLGTARVRAGVVFDRLMIFGTGGLAIGKPDNRVDFDAELTATGGTVVVDPFDEVSSFSGRSNEIQVGWTAGIGAEYAITDKVTLKAEYMYYDLGYNTVAATGSDSETFSAAYGFANTGQTARVGLNYRF